MGPFLVLISATCFGALAIFGTFAHDAGVATSTMLLVRFVLAAAVLGTLVAVRPELRRPPRAPVPEHTVGGRGGSTATLVLTALGLGAVGYALQAGFYFSALLVMDASLVALVLYTFPLMVTAVAVVLGRDRLTRQRVLALLAAVSGTVVVLLGAGGAGISGRGVLLGLGSALTYTVYILVSDSVLKRMAPVVLSALVMTGAAGSLAVWTAAGGGVDLEFAPSGWFWLGCLALVSTVVAMLTFFAGLRRTGPSTAAILSTFEPVVTTALATIMLGQFLTPVQMLGGFLVLSAVVLLKRPSPNAPVVRPRSRSYAGR